MKALLLALTTAVSLYGASELATIVLPQASESAAKTQITLVVRRADLAVEGDGSGKETSWKKALDIAVKDLRRNDSVSLEGTTVYWRNGMDCWFADLPTQDTLVKVSACEVVEDEQE